MSAVREPHDFDVAAQKLRGAILEHSGLAVERMPGLDQALGQFVTEAPRRLMPLIGDMPGMATIEKVHGTTIIQAIGDCDGLSAAIYASNKPEARLLLALDERIDDLIVASIFGEGAVEGVERDPGPEAPSRTAIETELVEEFARARPRARGGLLSVCAAFARPRPPRDAERRFRARTAGLAAAAARFSLPLKGGACERLVLLPQTFLLPLRKELEREQAAEAAPVDRRWSRSMETANRQGCR